MTHRSLPKTLSLALALAAASLSPLLLSGTAFAGAPQDATKTEHAAKGDAAPAKNDHASAKNDAASKGEHARTDAAKGDHAANDGKSTKAPAKAKAKAKAKKSAATKGHATAKAHAKSDKAAAPKAKTKRTAARETKPTSKRAKTPAKSDGDSPRHASYRADDDGREAGHARGTHRGKAGAARAKTSRSSSTKRGEKACVGSPVSLDRGGVEGSALALVDCHGEPLDDAVAKVSVLARPWGAPKRASATAVRVDSGLLTRIDAIAKKLPGKTISLVGGPSQSTGGSSAHRAGRAVDFSVDGVDNQKLVELCRALADTGCGYYPNASFVHIDVRDRGAGKVYWIDASEPGELPRYVSAWPPSQASGRDSSTTK